MHKVLETKKMGGKEEMNLRNEFINADLEVLKKKKAKLEETIKISKKTLKNVNRRLVYYER